GPVTVMRLPSGCNEGMLAVFPPIFTVTLVLRLLPIRSMRLPPAVVPCGGLTRATTGARTFTVAVADAEYPPYVAVIVAVPFPTGATIPVVVTVATAALLEAYAAY